MEQPKKNWNWWKTPRAKKTFLFFFLATLVGLTLWRLLFYPYVSTDDARVAMTIVRIAPSGIGGRVTLVNAKEGTLVKEGQVLVEIDHRIPEAALSQAKAKVEFTEKELKRMHQLSMQNAITPQALDAAQLNNEEAKANLQRAEVALENTYLKSPFDGVVIQKVAEVGNILDPGQTALAVANADHAWISANIEETSVKDVKIDQPVKITIDEGGTITGKVKEIRFATASQFALIPSDNAAGNFTKLVQRIPIKIEIDPDQEKNYRVGQSVEIKIRVH